MTQNKSSQCFILDSCRQQSRLSEQAGYARSGCSHKTRCTGHNKSEDLTNGGDMVTQK